MDEEKIDKNSEEDNIDENEITDESEVVEEEQEVVKTPEEMITDLEAQLEESKNETLRLHAEFQNFQNRTQKEKTAAITYAHETIGKDLLAVMDTFDNALASMGKIEDEAVKVIEEGVTLTYEQLTKALSKHGIEEVSIEDGYDPNFHQAIMQVDSEEHESGEIVQVLQKGYMIKERVLRPAMVSTCK